ncbi:MAG: hypothetical protein HY043_00830 [Verrucomicrobia bacterium]|nr:hypothetical protein [Verrucomicrobiota bacterium]
MQRNILTKTGTCAILSLLLHGHCALGQLKINSFTRSGEITWSGANPTNAICLQWASAITGPWQSTLNGQSLLLSATVTKTSVAVAGSPTFYRIRTASTSSLADALTEGATKNLNRLAIRFDPPPSSGRPYGGGMLISSDSSFDAFGSTWELDYEGNDPSSGFQAVHPYKSGQCIISIKHDSVGLDAPERWLEVGYGGGNFATLTRLADYNTFFPLKNAKKYHFKTTVSSAGGVSIFVNEVLVATGKLGVVNAIDFTVTEFENFPGGRFWAPQPFRGTGFPQQWQKGHAGIIVEPTDRGGGDFNGVFSVQYAPGL